MGESKELSVVTFHLTEKEQVVLGGILTDMEVKTRNDRRSKEACISGMKLDWVVDTLDDRRAQRPLEEEIEANFDHQLRVTGSKRTALIATVNFAINRVLPFDERTSSKPVRVQLDKTIAAWLLDQLDKLNQVKEGEKAKLGGTQDVYLARVESRIAAAKEGHWTPPPELAEAVEPAPALAPTPDAPAPT